jgi:hypothetical protein
MAPVVRAKFSPRYWAVRKRIQRLPVLTIGMLKAHAKRDAKGIIKYFQDGLKDKTLRLKPLRPATVKAKKKKGWALPRNPLYGIGLDNPRTYINMLEVIDKGNRAWVVKPKRGLHRQDPDDPKKKRLTLKQLFDIHEYGVNISNGFGRGIPIRIPARPALRYAYRKYMAQRSKDDPTLAIRNAIAKYVEKGNVEALARIKKKLERGFYHFQGSAAG